MKRERQYKKLLNVEYKNKWSTTHNKEIIVTRGTIDYSFCDFNKLTSIQCAIDKLNHKLYPTALSRLIFDNTEPSNKLPDMPLLFSQYDTPVKYRNA